MIATRSHEPLGLVEIVGGEQDRHLLARAQPGDHVEQLVADPRIEADRRLVEEQHLRLRHQRAGDLEAAALAAAVAADRAGRSARRGRARRPARRSAGRPRRRSTPHSRAWSSRFARPVSPRSTTASWKTTLLTLRAASGSRRRRRSRPAERCRRSGAIVVVSMPIVVDLPAPFGPSRPNTSPAATVEVDALDRLDAAGIGLAKRADLDRTALGCCLHGTSASPRRDDESRRPTASGGRHIGPRLLRHPYDDSRREGCDRWTSRAGSPSSSRRYRPHLQAVAYRMLGSVSEAEDAVQEAWLRLSRADTDDVENLGGWLTTVVGRVSPRHAARAAVAARGRRRQLAARADREPSTTAATRSRRRCSPTRSGWRCSSCSRR